MKKIIIAAASVVTFEALAFVGLKHSDNGRTSQSEVTENSQVAFYIGNELQTLSLNGKPTMHGDGFKIKKEKIHSTSDINYISTFTKEELSNLNLSKGYVFFQGIKSPFDDRWVYLERSMNNMDYNLCAFSPSENLKKIICTQDSNPTKNNFISHKPIAWSKEKNVIYTEAFEFGSVSEHEGIWECNIETGKFIRLNITSAYMSTPILSPDKSYFVYSGTSNIERDQLHGLADRLYLYDITQNKEKLIQESNGKYITLIGWIDKFDKSDIIDINSSEK
jgi:hypothetical protein